MKLLGRTQAVIEIPTKRVVQEKLFGNTNKVRPAILVQQPTLPDGQLGDSIFVDTGNEVIKIIYLFLYC